MSKHTFAVLLMEFTPRIQALPKFLFEKKNKIDGFLFSKWESIYYLSGFSGSYGRLLLTPKEAILISDSRYTARAQAELKTPHIQFQEKSLEKEFWSQFFTAKKIEILGFEADDISIAALKNMKKHFGKNLTLQPVEDTLRKIRIQKSAAERKILRDAAERADQTLRDVLPFLKTGVSEAHIAWLLEKTAREKYGAEGMSFSPIVAFGVNSARPHHESGATKLKENTPVLIDFGIKYQKYCSDMTRSFFFGTPTVEWQDAYALVKKAQDAAIEKIKAGASAKKIDESARAAFGSQKEYFTHSLGHGVGLEIHEAPTVSAQSRDTLQENMVVTIEPGLYFPEKFGIRIEDIGIVTAEGFESFSKAPYKIDEFLVQKTK